MKRQERSARTLSVRRMNTYAIAMTTMLFGVSNAQATELHDVKSVELNIHGRVQERCELGSMGNVSFGDLRRPGLSSAMHVLLNCNVPFDLRIQAANGGLANAEHPEGEGPYAGTLPYVVGVSIPVMKPQAALVTRSFEGRELIGGSTVSSGGGVAFDGMQLSVALGSPPSEAGLLAGKYGETIVITVSPS
ncbi:hypothetical protein SAMN05216382_1141 [Sphingomonas palmae]|uniref:Spore coat protein U domain-containing protein n=1 Tax=Sphingomonas palmae TaxID=1855283 RepID=A0A1H7L3B9_9SPHN|nr:hypothetical protein [Sphingomonas palmae]SEK93529.1 hypothetical protein SAMN05216382_1141 [Sphingomonas palmae]